MRGKEFFDAAHQSEEPDTESLQFSVSEIKEKGRAQYKGLAPQAGFQPSLGENAVLLGPVSVEMALKFQDGDIGLKGRAGGRWKLPCSRCLVVTEKDFDAKMDEVFEEPGSLIDGVEEVRQALILAVPMQAFCKPDCKGLCLTCGKNKNVGDCGCRPTPFNGVMNKGSIQRENKKSTSEQSSVSGRQAGRQRSPRPIA